MAADTKRRKVCRRCCLDWPFESFSVDSRHSTGRNSACRQCIKEEKAPWVAANRERVRKMQQAYVDRHPERVQRSKLAYFEANREKALAAARKWQAENPHARNAATARRYVRKKQATPPWACRYIIEWYYFDALWMTEQTGVAHQVDHVVPLRGKTVCGLHCEDNLQVIPAAANHRKHAKFE